MKTILPPAQGPVSSPQREFAGSIRFSPAQDALQTPLPQRQALLRTGIHRSADELFLQKIRAIISRRLSDELRVEDIAAAVFLTRVQVFRKTKELTGLSPSRFVRLIRLKKALELLRTTGSSITEIAYTVGFSDPKYFARVFTAEYGRPPSAFRKILDG